MAGKKNSLNDCYVILKIPQNSTMEAVKQAYRKLAFELHPDLNPNSASANTEFHELNEAYVFIINYLNDQEKKKSAKASFFDAQANTKKATKDAAKQKAWEEEIKAKEEREKKEQVRKERQEREKEADERRRAFERAEREVRDRERIRERIEKDEAKRQAKKDAERAEARRKEAEQDALLKERLMKQMADEAQRSKDAAKRDAAKREAAQRDAAQAEQDKKTRSYSNAGKPILDQNKYHEGSVGPDGKNSSASSSDSNKKIYYRSKNYGDEDIKEQILQELLEDDYARKVYEDISSELHARKREQNNFTEPNARVNMGAERSGATHSKTISADSVSSKTDKNAQAASSHITGQIATGIKQGLSGWFKNQINDELELFFPASKLVAGARMRLQIRIGWSGELQTLEIKLPADFVPGKPIRLKGMGKKIGKWQGDLYLKLQVK